MRDYVETLERRLTLAARAEEQRGPLQRLGRAAASAPPLWLALPGAAIAIAVAALVVFSGRTTPTAGTSIHSLAGTTPTAPSSVTHVRPVSFRFPSHGPDSGDIIATVTDPFAAQSSLNAAFKTAGLNIVVILVPASPSIVGTVLSMSYDGPEDGPQIETLYANGCVTGSGGDCPVGLKIPRDFSGQATVTLGRPAKPGEAYVSTTSAFAPGETLHCSGLLNEQVAEALPTIQADKLTAYWGVPGNDPPPVLGATSGPQIPNTTAPPGDYYILSADPIAAGIVWLRAAPTPLSAAELQREQQTYNQGC